MVLVIQQQYYRVAKRQFRRQVAFRSHLAGRCGEAIMSDITICLDDTVVNEENENNNMEQEIIDVDAEQLNDVILLESPVVKVAEESVSPRQDVLKESNRLLSPSVPPTMVVNDNSSDDIVISSDDEDDVVEVPGNDKVVRFTPAEHHRLGGESRKIARMARKRRQLTDEDRSPVKRIKQKEQFQTRLRSILEDNNPAVSHEMTKSTENNKSTDILVIDVNADEYVIDNSCDDVMMLSDSPLDKLRHKKNMRNKTRKLRRWERKNLKRERRAKKLLRISSSNGNEEKASEVRNHSGSSSHSSNSSAPVSSLTASKMLQSVSSGLDKPNLAESGATNCSNMPLPSTSNADFLPFSKAVRSTPVINEIADVRVVWVRPPHLHPNRSEAISSCEPEEIDHSSPKLPDVGSNVCIPDSGLNTREESGLRPVFIDANNVGFSHGRNQQFSFKGVEMCVNYFKRRGHKVFAILPNFRKGLFEQKIIDDWQTDGTLVTTPSRRVEGRLIVPEDDRYVIQCAAAMEGIIVTTDHYRDHLGRNPLWDETIKRRLLMFTWVGDLLIFPDDPLGRSGPTLDVFLKFPPKSKTIRIIPKVDTKDTSENHKRYTKGH